MLFIRRSIRFISLLSLPIHLKLVNVCLQVDCRLTVSEMKSCTQDRSRIEVDAEYCEAVDYRGRPIGEYGQLFL